MKTSTSRPRVCKPQAREIVRYAKRHGINLRRGAASWEFPNLCARGVLFYSVKDQMTRHTMYSYELHTILGLTSKQINSLEAGFENYENRGRDQTYYKVGRRVAQMVGLPVD